MSVAHFTRRDYERLPEGFPAQLVAGRLVREPAPSYGHQRLVGRLYRQLVELVGEDLAVVAPVDVVLDDHNVYQPDVVVLRAVPEAEARSVGVPRLVVEVLSPATADRDRTIKTDRLLAAGVEEVWLVDAQAESVERHRASGIQRAAGAEAVASDAVPGFVLEPASLFDRGGPA